MAGEKQETEGKQSLTVARDHLRRACTMPLRKLEHSSNALLQSADNTLLKVQCTLRQP